MARAAAVGLAVGGDEALVEAPADFDGDVILVGENGFQAGFLASAEQRVPGAQGAPHPIEQIPGAAAVPAGLLLDTLTTQIQLRAGLA